MSTMLAFDDRGRVTIPRHLRDGLGDRVVAIRTPHGLVLHPVPKHVHLPVPAKGISGEDSADSET